jgi:DNA-directed RNA polymerase alpha subunit
VTQQQWLSHLAKKHDAIKLEDSGLDSRTITMLTKAGMRTVGDVSRKTVVQLVCTPGIGSKSVNGIIYMMSLQGRLLKDEAVWRVLNQRHVDKLRR